MDKDYLVTFIFLVVFFIAIPIYLCSIGKTDDGGENPEKIKNLEKEKLELEIKNLQLENQLKEFQVRELNHKDVEQ